MSAITSRLSPASSLPWRLIGAVAALLLALAAGLALYAAGTQSTRPAPPFGLAANGSIFYSDHGRLYARAPGGEVTPLLSGDTNDTNPVVSYDGTSLSFLRHVQGDAIELWTVKTDGSAPRRLPIPYTQLSWFEWAPGGDAAVLQTDSQRQAITVMPTNGGQPVAYDLGVEIDQPFFRPTDGSQLSFLGTDNAGDHGIWIVGRDGTGLTRLDLDPGFRNDQYYDENRCCYFWTQSWSPTGDRLLYTQLEPDPTSPAGPGFRMHVASIGLDGAVTDDRVLEFDRQADDELGGVFLPKEDAIVFQSIEGSQHFLWYAPMGASGPGAEESLGLVADDWMSFQVSPDGTQLLVVMPAPEGVTQDVYLVDLSSRQKTKVDLGADASWQRVGR